MQLHETLTLPQSPTGTAAMYADEGYAAVRREALGASAAHAAVTGDPAGAFTVRTELTLPTDGVPDMVRPFVGTSVTVSERQEWQAPQADGSRTGTMHLQVAGTPASLEARMELRPSGEGSVVEIRGELTARVPLLGSRLEKAAVPYVARVLRAEERAAADYAQR